MTLLQHLRSKVAGAGVGLVRRVKAVVSGIAFWTGIAIPLAYPLFMIPDVVIADPFTTILALIAINYLALLLGNPHYNPSDS